MASISKSHNFPKIILAIIVAAALAAIIAIVCLFLLRPEHQAKLQISALASDYYENFFYETMFESDNFSGDPAKALQKYESSGLESVTLRQLLLIDQSNTDTSDYLLKYCDENATSVKFFPESPYSRTAYHTDYTYSCNF